MTVDVLIVGAGPTGLVLALELAHFGVRVRIVDRSSGPGHASRAMTVQARTLELYDRLGHADEIVARGIRIERVHLREDGDEVAVFGIGDIGEGLSPFPFVLSFPQDEHERVLGDRLRDAGVAVEWNTELVRFTQDGDRVRAVLRTEGAEETVETAYLCGCDGAHSAVREGLGLGFPGGTYEQRFFVADVEASGRAANGQFNMCLGANVFCAIFPIRTSGMVRLIGIVPEHIGERESVTLEDVRPEVERLGGLRVERENWFSTYRVHHRVAKGFRDGRAFIAGDAGHVHSPAGGQGMNTGIGDAVNLAWKLAAALQGRANPSILDTYEAERIAFARLLVATTDRLFRGIIDRRVSGRLVRTVLVPRLLPLLLGFSSARRAAFRMVSQIRISYRDSALSEGAAGDVQGGDRLPWVPGADNFRPLRSRDWQVHVYGAARGALRASAAARGLPLWELPFGEEAARAGLAEGALYLVRPDGYVSVASAGQDVATLERFMDAHGIAARR